jgi:hypothetical protein
MLSLGSFSRWWTCSGQLMERQAIHRLEAGSLSRTPRPNVSGETLLLLARWMAELKESFGLQDGDLDLDLGLAVDDLG